MTIQTASYRNVIHRPKPRPVGFSPSIRYTDFSRYPSGSDAIRRLDPKRSRLVATESTSYAPED